MFILLFQINTVNLEALARNIDPSQLTADLDGSLQYDHAQWIDVRLAVEDFTWQATDLLDRLDDLQEDLSRNDFADDVGGAKHGIDLHNEMKKKIMKVPVEGVYFILFRFFHSVFFIAHLLFWKMCKNYGLNTVAFERLSTKLKVLLKLFKFNVHNL